MRENVLRHERAPAPAVGTATPSPMAAGTTRRLADPAAVEPTKKKKKARTRRTEPRDTGFMLPTPARDSERIGTGTSTAAPRWWARRNRTAPGERTGPRLPSPAEQHPGTTIAGGRYEVRRVIGEGGMGVVLEVLDLDLRRPVAMKVLRPDREVGEALSRFVEEAQIGSQLEHPNIMPIHDIGMLTGGYVYYTMQMVTGRSLQQVLNAPRTSRGGLGTSEGLLQEGLDILGKMLSAVAYAHDKGVLHRDLKPENIMIGRFDEVLVMDWGLAKVFTDDPLYAARPSRSADELPMAEFSDEHGPVTTIRGGSDCPTRDGQVAGSLPYMAPEQARGETHRIDTRTDVWALGAILYTLLAGFPPHLHGAARNSQSELLKSARRGTILRLERSRWGEPVPPGLAEIAYRALHPDPMQRYNDAGEMLEDLKAFAHRTSGRARPIVRGWAGESGRSRRTGKPGWHVAAGVAVTTLAAMLWRMMMG